MKLKDFSDKLILAIPETNALPVPRNEIVFGKALLKIAIPATRDPVSAGLNETLMVQLPFRTIGPPQLLEAEKSAACAPVNVSVEICNVAAPELTNLIVRTALVVCTVWLAKLKLVGLTDTTAVVCE